MFRLTATTLRATTVAIPILLATAIAIPALLATSIAAPASAQQISVGIGFDNFHSQLAPYGTWSNHSRWGDVWRPRADRDFRPYYNGHWEDTREYGWLWISQDSWGDVPYHYGRWVFDPREGWLWVPGYVWAPSWVVWREGGGNIGWFPMPPGDNYYGDGPYRDNFANQYGYRDWYGPSFGNDQFLSLWIFVGQDHFRDRNFRNYAVPQRDYGTFISQTTNTTNYVTINNYVVNRSVDRGRLERATNQRMEQVPARSVIGPKTIVTQATVGRQVEQRERQRRPIPTSIDRSNQLDRDNLKANAQQQQKANLPQPGVRGRDNDRDAARPAIDTSRQKDRSRANVNPAEQRGRGDAAESKAQQPDTNQATQSPRNRERDEPNANGRARTNAQTDRDPRVTNTPPSNNDAARPGLAERRNRDAEVPTQVTPAEKRSQANPQAERGKGSFQAPQTRGASDEKGKVIVQDARPSPRAQGNPPDADRQGNTRTNEAGASKQSGTKNADDQEKADDKRRAATADVTDRHVEKADR